MIIIHSEEKSRESTCDTSDDGGAGSGGSKQHNLGNITVGDIVWAKEGRGPSASDEFWWPAKVIDTRSSSNSSKVEVHWFNRDSGRHPIKIKANLIKPFMDMIQVYVVLVKVIHPKYYKHLKKGAHQSHLGRQKMGWFLAD